MKTLYLVLLLGSLAFAQQSTLRLPRDSQNNPLMAGLGLPYLFEPTVNVTAYDATVRSALDFTGPNTNRQFRHLSIYNPSTTLTVYVCLGTSSGCSRDMFKARPGVGVVDDFAFFGAGNNITYLYYRLGSAGTVSPDVRVW